MVEKNESRRDASTAAGEKTLDNSLRKRQRGNELETAVSKRSKAGVKENGNHAPSAAPTRRTRHQIRANGGTIDPSNEASLVDLSDLIGKASECTIIDQVESILEETWPRSKGNNIQVQALKETYRALDLGLYTNRKMAIPGMAMMLWLLGGKVGEEAAYEAACAVKNAKLPSHLSEAISQRGHKKCEGKTVMNKYLAPPGKDKDPDPGNQSTPANVSEKSMKELLRKFSSDFIQLASVGRLVMGTKPGEKITFPKLFKTEFLANQEIRFYSRKTKVNKEGVINETGSGIICKCTGCTQAPKVIVMSPKDFLGHVNAKQTEILDCLKLQKYNQSFRQLATLLSSEKLADIATDVYPDHCFQCKLGGDLLCCDGCTTAWHVGCTSLSCMPADDTPWLCPLCEKDGHALDKKTVEGRRKFQRMVNKAIENKKKGKGRKPQGGYKPKTGGSGGGRVRMMAPERHGRPVRNLNRNKRLFEGEQGGLISGMRVHYRARGENIIGGYIVINPSGQSGIRCDCCSKIISCSQFESHAGHAQRRQPYEHIYVEEEGVNLKKIAARLPERTEGGADGGDTHDVYNDLDALTGGCIFCREPDFQKGDFGSRTIMICDQCEREYHVGCLEENGMGKLESLPEGDWFCDSRCGYIHGHFKALVKGGEMNVDVLSHNNPANMDMSEENELCGEDIEQSIDADSSGMRRSSRTCVLAPKNPIKESPYKLDLEGYSWQVLNGSDGTEETEAAINDATRLLQESFDPIMDLSTNTDLLPLMINAEQHADWDYTGVHTLLLKYMDTPVVAAIVRVFGPQMAELPLIATLKSQRRRGHAKVLVDLFQKHLSIAGVHRLVLPAAHETVAAWKGGFYFEDMPHEQVRLAKHQLKVLVFPGTEMLWKTIDGIKPPTGHHVLKPILTEEEENDLIFVARSIVNKIERDFEILAKTKVNVGLSMNAQGEVKLSFTIELPKP